jgi:hypothetical protein
MIRLWYLKSVAQKKWEQWIFVLKHCPAKKLFWNSSAFGFKVALCSWRNIWQDHLLSFFILQWSWRIWEVTSLASPWRSALASTHFQPSLMLTQATTFSPRRLSGVPITTTLATAGCWDSTSSTWTILSRYIVKSNVIVEVWRICWIN